MGTALYVPCLAIETITGGALKAIPLIITLGAVVTLYTMLGGIQAVIWTDIIQFCIMLTGVAVAISVILWNVDGGLAAVWRLGMDAGKIDFYYELPIPAGASLWDKFLLYMGEPKAMSAILITTICGRMAGYTSDQVMVQRFQTTKSLKDSRQAFIINACGDAIWTLGLAFVGLALFAFYQTHVLPPEIAENTDRIFPHFMATVFPTGLIGLVVAAILAASLSSIDSAINSCTSVIVVDFYNRLFLGRQVALPSKPAATLGKHNEAETAAAAPAAAAAPQALHHASPDADRESRRQLFVSRIATLCFGCVGILIAANVSRIGIVLEIGAKVIQTFTGPILGIYVLGMFTRRTSSAGVVAGGLIGTAAALFIAFGQKPVFGSEIITFIWPTVFGLVGTLIGGYVMSMILPGRATEQQKQLTWRNVMRQALPIEDGHGQPAAPATTPAAARV
jgi:Na+/proline symporter